MKIAFYLGSFNPFHNGHLKVIKNAFENYGMNRVVIVPTMHSPWKHNKILGFYDRCNMIVLSLADLLANNNYDITLEYIERELAPPYYSINTLNALKDKYGKNNNELYILCGQDTMEDIPKWYEGQEILNNWKFLVVDRPEESISSTKIREMVKNCEDISPYVNRRVVKMINRYYYYEV